MNTDCDNTDMWPLELSLPSYNFHSSIYEELSPCNYVPITDTITVPCDQCLEKSELITFLQHKIEKTTHNLRMIADDAHKSYEYLSQSYSELKHKYDRLLTDILPWIEGICNKDKQ